MLFIKTLAPNSILSHQPACGEWLIAVCTAVPLPPAAQHVFWPADFSVTKKENMIPMQKLKKC